MLYVFYHSFFKSFKKKRSIGLDLTVGYSLPDSIGEGKGVVAV